MSHTEKILNLIFISCLINACTDKNPSELVIQTSSHYLIEMDSGYKVSRYSYFDSEESYLGDNNAIVQYSYYNDSIVITSDGRSVTARGDYSKTIYFLNNKGLADSSHLELDPGNLPKRFGRNFYTYDLNSYLLKDSSINTDQNGGYLSSSVMTYEYSGGNNTKLIIKYPGSSTYSYTYTYNELNNLFSLFGSFKGKPNRNQVESTIYTSQNADNVTLASYTLYSNGLIDEATYSSFSNSVKYVYVIKYEYTITN